MAEAVHKILQDNEREFPEGCNEDLAASKISGDTRNCGSNRKGGDEALIPAGEDHKARETSDESAEGVVGYMQSKSSTTADTAGGYVETAKDQAGKVADAAYHAPGHAYNAAADTATKSGQKVQEGAEGVGGYAHSTASKITDTVGGYVQTAKGQAGKVAGAAYHAPGHVYDAAADTATKAGEKVWEGAEGVGGCVQSTASKVTGAAEGYVESAKGQAGKVADTAYHAPGHVYHNATEAAATAGGKIYEVAESVVQGAVGYIHSAASYVTGNVKSHGDSVEHNQAGETMEAAQKQGVHVMESAQKQGRHLAGAAHQQGSQAVEAASHVPEQASQAASQAAEKVGGAVGDLKAEGTASIAHNPLESEEPAVY